MPSSTHLPTRFPVGSKYVLEGRRFFVRRYIEFPDGHRVQLPTRKVRGKATDRYYPRPDRCRG